MSAIAERLRQIATIGARTISASTIQNPNSTARGEKCRPTPASTNQKKLPEKPPRAGKKKNPPPPRGVALRLSPQEKLAPPALPLFSHPRVKPAHPAPHPGRLTRDRRISDIF